MVVSLTKLLNCGRVTKFCFAIELELDFAEEDVEFADRTQFRTLNRIEFVLKRLIDSRGRKRNQKRNPSRDCRNQTWVNQHFKCLNEERAIVSEIAGTTRDTIEDELVIGGIAFVL
jgi:tRNA modification GTPase